MRTGDAETVGVGEERGSRQAADEGDTEAAFLRGESQVQPAVLVRSTQAQHVERAARQLAAC